MPPKRSATLDDVRFSVLAVDHLDKWPDAPRARALLDEAVAVINVLLARRRWTIVRVSEFFPRSANLLGLNVNHGEHVKIRIRRPQREGTAARGAARSTSMYAFEEIMCTLIHETVHNTISPHDERFWRLYHELVAECEGIIAAGLHRPQGDARNAPASPAVAAPTVEAVPFSGSGRRLGGSAPAPGASMAVVCASAAARRLRATATRLGDATTCCGSQRSTAGVHSPAVGESPSAVAQCGPGRIPGEEDASSTSWCCAVCGAVNHPLLPYCEWCCGDDVQAPVIKDDDAALQAAVAASLELQLRQPQQEPFEDEPRSKVHRRECEVIDLTAD